MRKMASRNLKTWNNPTEPEQMSANRYLIETVIIWHIGRIGSNLKLQHNKYYLLRHRLIRLRLYSKLFFFFICGNFTNLQANLKPPQWCGTIKWTKIFWLVIKSIQVFKTDVFQLKKIQIIGSRSDNNVSFKKTVLRRH
jgi:hypothetical protein